MQLNIATVLPSCLNPTVFALASSKMKTIFCWFLLQLARRGHKPVPSSDARATADKIGAFDYLECSAKENKGLHEVFHTATRAAMCKSKGKRRGSFLKSILGGGAAEDPEKAKLKEEALAAKAKAKEEAAAEKARVKQIQTEEKAEKARVKAAATAAAQAESARAKAIATADKQEKVAWKQRYAAASPSEKARMKADADDKEWLKTATPLQIKLHRREKAADAAAAAAAAAAREAFMSGAPVAPPSPSPSAPVFVESAYETLATTMQQKRPCPYVSSKGSCNRMFVAGAHITFCKMHTCTKVGCNAKKTSRDEFCPRHADGGGGGGGDEEGDEHDYDLTGDSVIDPAAMAAFAEDDVRVSKYVAPEIRLGKPEQSALGLEDLMGINHMIGKIMMMKEKAIMKEYAGNGSAEDQDNLKHVLAGTLKMKGDGRADWGRSKGQSVTLDALLATEQAKTAHLELHHVLALRLYTTSSYSRVNDPLRENPLPKQHPFAATAMFIRDGIRKLRAVDAKSGATDTKVFWRGMKNLSLSQNFGKEGGAEFACMSTTSDIKIATERFAEGSNPLIFKYVTDTFMDRGADISFLSVYPEEKEVLYPPLTYLKPVSVKKQKINGRWFIVAEVTPRLA